MSVRNRTYLNVCDPIAKLKISYLSTGRLTGLTTDRFIKRSIARLASFRQQIFVQHCCIC